MDLRLYAFPEIVGYLGWIETADGMYFVDLDGVILKPDMGEAAV